MLTARILLPFSFHLTGDPWPGSGTEYRVSVLRLFCKPFSIDIRALVVAEMSVAPEALTAGLAEIATHKVPGLLARQPVFLKAGPVQTAGVGSQENTACVTAGFHLPGSDARCWLVMPGPFLEALYKLYGFQPDPKDPSPLHAFHRHLYQLCGLPGPEFGRSLLLLPDRGLQLLLGRFLHQNIATPYMIAAFIRDLGDDGRKLLANLPGPVRQEVNSHMRVKSGMTYRLISDIRYLFNRNLYLAAREQEIEIPGTAWAGEISLQFELAAAGGEGPMLELVRQAAGQAGLRRILNEFPRPVLTSALSLLPRHELMGLFSGELSEQGYKLLGEDLAWQENKPLRERQAALIRLARWLRRLCLEAQPMTGNFEQEIIQLVRTPGDLELLIFEAGLIPAVKAMRYFPAEWQARMLQGQARALFDDTAGGPTGAERL